MSITTRAELITAIQTWAVRPDFGAATVDDYITLTEAIFNNGDGALGSGDYIAPLRCREMITTGTVIPITAGTGTLPTDFNEAIRATTKRDIAARKNVEEDLQRLIPGATLMTCSGFGDAIIRRMK